MSLNGAVQIQSAAKTDISTAEFKTIEQKSPFAISAFEILESFFRNTVRME